MLFYLIVLFCKVKITWMPYKNAIQYSNTTFLCLKDYYKIEWTLEQKVALDERPLCHISLYKWLLFTVIKNSC